MSNGFSFSRNEDLNILAEIIKENVENTKASQMALI
jgi:hypothetical protein